MKLLVLDNDGEGTGLDLALRAQDADHEVRYWLPPFQTGKPRPYGNGMVEKPVEWKPSMSWAELTVLTGNSTYVTELAEYFGKGFPIFGANAKAAELELDREVGQRVLKECGVKTLPYTVVTSADEAIALVTRTRKAYAMKPWGGEADKAMTYVADSPDDAIFVLSRWKREGLFKGQLMLQEKIGGVEIGISGMFGPAGWCRAIEESFEHKKFLNDDLGCNTGEMGTVIRHVMRSKLFDEVLEPITDYLHSVNYVGDCAINCIVDKEGNPWPLEFTMRLGWPDFCIRQAVIKGDPVEWMAELIFGSDRLSVSPQIAVGVCLVHGDFPEGKDPAHTWVGYPIYGVSDRIYRNLHWQQAAEGRVPMLLGETVQDSIMPITAGNYPLVVTGTGGTVAGAAAAAYEVAWSIKMPSNLMFRTDIGSRLAKGLPELQKHGFAKGMQYG